MKLKLRIHSWLKLVQQQLKTVKTIVLKTVATSLLQSHTDKRSFIVYLWTVCTLMIYH